MKVTSVTINLLGPPESQCKCGEGEWLEASAGDLNGYRCSACGKHDIGQIGFDDPVEYEEEVQVERHEDGSATIRFGESASPAIS